MLMLHGDHDSDHDADGRNGRHGGSWSKAPAFADDPERAAAVRAATQADRDRYLTSGLQPVDCRFCHVTVNVKKLGPGHTAVQWNTEASQRCAYFAELRASGDGQRAHQGLPEAGRQHRTRRCRRVSGGGRPPPLPPATASLHVRSIRARLKRSFDLASARSARSRPASTCAWERVRRSWLSAWLSSMACRASSVSWMPKWR